MDPITSAPELPLFPLQTVLFPGGQLGLRVFEARYLDLMATCLREQRGFGVVALRSGKEVQRAGVDVRFEAVGVMAELIDVDSEQAGILQVRCRGSQRFELGACRQQSDGLWLTHARLLPDDEPTPPPATLQTAVKGLASAIESLKSQDVALFLEPYQLDDAGWVANRWCELLPIEQAAKQRLMQLPDPVLRLKLVNDFLHDNGVLG